MSTRKNNTVLLTISLMVYVTLVGINQGQNVGEGSSQLQKSNWNSLNESSTVWKKCNTEKNPFLPYLVSMGVTLLKLPQKVQNKCIGEWDQFGTCCDSNSLASFAQSLSKSNTKIETEFTVDMQSIISVWTEQITFLRNISTNQTHIRTLSEKLKLVKSSNELEEKMFDIKNIMMSFSNHQHKCLQRQSTFRSLCLCGLCSGRSEAFFNGDKLTVEMSECKATIKECDPYWRSLIGLLQIVEKIELIWKEIKDISNLKTDVFEDDNHKELLQWIVKADLDKSLKTCDAKTCDDTAAVRICSSLMSAHRKDPLTESSLENLNDRSFKYSNLALLYQEKIKLQISEYTGPKEKPSQTSSASRVIPSAVRSQRRLFSLVPIVRSVGGVIDQKLDNSNSLFPDQNHSAFISFGDVQVVPNMILRQKSNAAASLESVPIPMINFP